MTKKKEVVEEVPRDLSKERADRCEPVVKMILDELLKKNLLLKDVEYVEQKVKEQFEILLQHLVFIHANDVFKMVTDSLNFALAKAREDLWGKDPDNLSAADVQNVLTAAATNKKNSK